MFADLSINANRSVQFVALGVIQLLCELVEGKAHVSISSRAELCTNLEAMALGVMMGWWKRNQATSQARSQLRGWLAGTCVGVWFLFDGAPVPRQMKVALILVSDLKIRDYFGSSGL